jgi:hypothetical protein
MDQNQYQDEGDPIPQAGEKINESHPAAAGQQGLRVAYHAGPPDIGFFGRQWQRDVAQPVTADEWTAMRARGDFDEFNFTQET